MQNLDPRQKATKLLHVSVETPGLSLSDSDWQLVLPFLREHSLTGLVYSLHGPGIASSIRSEFHSDWKQQTCINQLYMDELKWLAGNLFCDVTVLKGMALLEDIYPDFGGRHLSELDLLVPPGDFPFACRVLHKRGYRLREENNWSGNEYKSTWYRESAGQELNIELHTKLFYKEAGSSYWHKSPWLNGGIQRLVPDDMLLHLCGYMVCQYDFAKLNYLVDIDRYIRKYKSELNWKEIRNRAEELQQGRALAATLFAAKKLLGTPIPNEVISTAPLRTFNSLISEKFLWSVSKNRFRYFLLKRLLKN